MQTYTLKKIEKTEEISKNASQIDYQNSLNRSQLEAVFHTDGPMLVIAGAGSGKTMTLVYRVIKLVEMGVNPEHILLLTFTKKAASEMLNRATKVLDARCRNISGGTFHSFANNMLRKYINLLNIKTNYTILDRADSEDAVNLVRSGLGLNTKDKRFPKKKAILNIISKSINKSASVNDIIEDEFQQFVDYTDKIIQIKNAYISYKKNRSILDYDDLLSYLHALLKNSDHVRNLLSNHYKYIMVDEYQDTNRLQAEIVKYLASSHRNVMVVGDDSQSIYAFRGANFKNIMDFPKIFPETRLVTLEQNYRSSQPILNLTNEIIENAKTKYTKKLFSKKKRGNLPVFIEAGSENEQSRFIAQRVLELREEGVPLKEISILFRAGWHSNDLEVELSGRNIPFVKFGGLKFIEAAHIKDLLAYMKVLYNPMDSIGWLRILLLIKGIGTVTALRIVREVVDNKKGFDYFNEKTLKGKKYKADLLSLAETLKSIRSNPVPPNEMLIKINEIYKPLMELKYDDFSKRLNDLTSLSRISMRYNLLEKFLSEITLEPYGKSQVDTEYESSDVEKLILSTIHSAKGLEWHSVFIISMVDGYIPSSRSINDENEIEEERRLFYVAATRAKENLYLIKPDIGFSPRNYSYDNSGSRFSEISRFLKEGQIFENLLDKYSLIRE